jgi:hypothetical protein
MKVGLPRLLWAVCWLATAPMNRFVLSAELRAFATRFVCADATCILSMLLNDFARTVRLLQHGSLDPHWLP